MDNNLPTNRKFQQFYRYYHVIEPILNKPNNRIYTTIIFSFLAISLFVFYAIKPTIQTIIYLRREIVDKTELDHKMTQKISNLIETQTNYGNIKLKLPLIDDAIPTNPEALDALNQFKNLVNTTQATISSVSINSVPLVGAENNPTTNITTVDKTQSKIVSLNMILEGSYPELEKCLLGILTMRRMISIESVSFKLDTESSQHTGTASASSISLSMQMKSYYK